MVHHTFTTAQPLAYSSRARGDTTDSQNSKKPTTKGDDDITDQRLTSGRSKGSNYLLFFKANTLISNMAQKLQKHLCLDGCSFLLRVLSHP